MSLLLDALNRASKDKSAAEAAAQPKATAEWPSISLTALPNESTPSDPSLTLEQPDPASRAAMQSPLQFPTLGLSLEPVLADLPSNALPATPDPTVSGRPIEPTLDEEPLLAALGLGLDPMPPAAQSEPAPPQAAAPEPAPEPTEPPMAETTPSPPVKPVPAKSSAQSSKVAQSIMRAKESTQATGTPRTRLLALGAVASLISVGATVLLTGWIDPLALLGQRSTVGLAATPTAAALTEPASVAVAPMAQQADGTSLPDNNVAASTPPQSRAPAATAAAKAGKKEAAGMAPATATVTSLPSQGNPEPATPTPTPTPLLLLHLLLRLRLRLRHLLLPCRLLPLLLQLLLLKFRGPASLSLPRPPNLRLVPQPPGQHPALVRRHPKPGCLTFPKCWSQRRRGQASWNRPTPR